VKKIYRHTAVLLFLVLGASGGAPAEAKMTVFASILPQRYFIEQIAKDRVEVRVMVEPGANPATYEPKPRQMVELTEAAAYFAIGVPFERTWLHKIAAANPAMKVVHTDRGIEKIPMAAHHHENGSHRENAAPHVNGIPDPHIWNSPPLVMIQARNIFAALVEIDPPHLDIYAENYRAFVQTLVELDAELMKMFSRKGRNDRFMVFHPSWGYFAQAYGLTQVPIEIEGKAPKPMQIRELIEHARQTDTRVVFVQPQFSTQQAEVIAREIGGRVVFADPLAPDWDANLRMQARTFRDAME